jgi:hypothetical protein
MFCLIPEINFEAEPIRCLYFEIPGITFPVHQTVEFVLKRKSRDFWLNNSMNALFLVAVVAFLQYRRFQYSRRFI